MSTCEQCENRGWALVYHASRQQMVVERCGFCDAFPSDHEAGEAAWESLMLLLNCAYNTGSLLSQGEYEASDDGCEDGERLVQVAFGVGINDEEEGRLTLGWGGAP